MTWTEWILASAETTSAENQQTITAEPISSSAETSGTKADSSAAPSEPAKQPPANPWMQMLPFILILVVMYLFLFRAPRKKQQEHQKMVASLKKNDRVRTIGGILGTVMDVREDEIVLKVDEATNTKIRVVPSAIATVITDTNKSQN